MKQVSICIVIHKGHVLCVRRSKASNRSGEWESPAGHIEPGETPPKAARREVFEETGLRVKLLPKVMKIKLRGDDGEGFIFVGIPQKSLKVKLDPKEHDAFRWVKLDKLSTIKRSPPKFEENIRKVLSMNAPKPDSKTGSLDGFLEPQQKVRQDRKASRKAYFVETHGFGALPDDLNDAVLLGDEVELFMSAHEDGYSKDGPVRGVVEKLGNNFLWLQKFSDSPTQDSDEPNLIKIDWRHKGKWDVIRIKRGRNRGEKLTYEKVGTGEGEGRTNGIALLIEPDLATPNEAMFSAFPNVSPDLNTFAAQQIPSTMQAVVDSNSYDFGLRTVRGILSEEKYLDDYTVSQGQRGRVLVLTTNPETKKQIRSILEKHGKKVKDLGGNNIRGRGTTAGLIVAEKKDLQVLELASIVMTMAKKIQNVKVSEELIASAYEFLRDQTGVTEGQARMMIDQYKGEIQAGNLQQLLQKFHKKGYNIPNLEGINPKNVLRFVTKYTEKDAVDEPIVPKGKQAAMPPAMPLPGSQQGKPTMTVQIPTAPAIQPKTTPQGVTLQTTDPKALQQTMQQIGQVDNGLSAPPGTMVRSAARIAISLRKEDYRNALRELSGLCRTASTAQMIASFHPHNISVDRWKALGGMALAAGEFPVVHLTRTLSTKDQPRAHRKRNL